jgi:outer membrane protein assembly factor BamB
MRRFLPALPLALVLLSGGAAAGDDWPQWLGPRRDGVWRETGIVDRFPKGGPPVLWRTPVGGGYAGPAVAEGRVFVTDRAGPKERILCLDEATGKILWKHEYPCRYAIDYPAGPRATPLVHEGKVYTLGAMGDLLCLETATGKVVWSKNFPRDYNAPVPGWGFAAHPLLDGDNLVCLVGGPGSVVVAFDRTTGAEKWKSLSMESQEIGYAPPMICELGGRRQLIVWHPEAVNGLDPETGKPWWSYPFRVKANLSVPTPRAVGDELFVTSFYNGPLLLRFTPGKDEPELVWKGNGRGETPGATDKLHSIMPAPVIKGGCIYGVCSYGELRCLRLGDGKRLWQTLEATCGGTVPQRWANAFLIEQGDRFFLFNEKGDLIIARLGPKGYEEVDRAHVLEPTNKALQRRVVWSHPAFANRRMYARNDKEIICVGLAKEDKGSRE